ncbi:L-rhamnose-binding lectin CSL3-like [Puntigrus tetrazona]|uniref:L-rhamnose-binding lectin CSL3-like n=1 Tax=Puntigrus tetrazona TaxID=1606681 RepID=UPI001C8B06C0|nr:L-rhamnose-binding lectin CSL3-like [Puntigrus tetrazona]
MVAQKLSWITLLLLLCQHACFLSARRAKTSLVCEGGSAHLSCDVGYIHVVSANYGRTDHKTCSVGRPFKQLSNNHCFEETSRRTMTVRCNGKKRCSVFAVNSVFSDPCPWTYKYLQVSYECHPQRHSIACEGTRSVIGCEKGVISVHHANYGRRDLGICPNRFVTRSDCYFSQTSSLRSRCDGKTSCHVDASNSVFSDPCHHVYKYLEVTYSCILLVFLCQYALGLIKVIKANYGRTDRTTCASGKPAHQTSNIRCVRGSYLRTMSTRCDGRKSCSVPAVNSVFSDPCVGTFKYLEVHYVCVRKDALRINQISASDSVLPDPVTASI